MFCVVFCFWLQFKLQQNNIDYKSIFGRLSLNYQLLIRLFILTTILVCFSFGIVMKSLSFISLTLPSFMESLIKDIHNSDYQLFLIPLYYRLPLEIFAFVIIGPVAEEFIFRGVLFHVWAAKYRIGLSILMSSLVFGILHLHPLDASISGIIYTLLYIKYHNLYVPIVVHSMNSAIVSAASLFEQVSDFNRMSTLEEVTNIWKIGVLLTTVTAPLVIHFAYKQWPSNKESLLPYFVNTQN